MRRDDLLRTLRDLEISLHQHAVRANRERLEALLHEDFLEFGRSGRSYDKAQIVALLLGEPSAGKVWSQDFALTALGEDTALLTYRSAVNEAGRLSRHALRSSVWVRTSRGWQLRFHQGTPTETFEKS
jgi:hypothetical protein